MSKRTKTQRTPSIVTPKEIATQGTSAMLRAGAELFKQPTMDPSQLAFIAVFCSVVPWVVGVGCEAFLNRKRRESQRFWDSITERWSFDSDKTPQEIAGLLQARKDEQHVNETIWRSIRGLMDAVDDAATVPLAVLAQDYLRQEQTPDWFFRGTVRLLQEMDRKEMKELFAALDWLLTSSSSRRLLVIIAVPKTALKSSQWELIIEEYADREDDRPIRTDHAPVESMITDPDRIFELLVQGSLGKPTRINRIGGPAADILLERSTAERLHQILSHCDG